MAVAIDAPAMRVVASDDAVIPELARVMVDAYPVMGVTTADAFAAFVERVRSATEDPVRDVAAERNGEVVGGMRLYDFVMNVRGSDAATGGVGAVAVALAHKRQGVARAMLAWYLHWYHKRGAPFAILHPFWSDFYRALGFGYGTPTHRFRFVPRTLRNDGARGTVRALHAGDLDAVLACSERIRTVTNGLVQRYRGVTEKALAELSTRHVGVEDAGVLRGFMQTSLTLGHRDVTNRNVLVVRDFQAEDGAAAGALLGYLRAQHDQFMEIAIETQDPSFFLASTDPRDRSDRVLAPPAAHRVAETGLGIMYRLLDVPAAFAYLPRPAQPFALRVIVDDTFFAPTAFDGTFRCDASGIRPDEHAAPDATLSVAIPELSSLVAGSLRLRDVARHRLATVEPASALPRVAELFDTQTPPVCTTRF
ncbi:hypothetical protein WPS_34680 [Vulcanimicrobium alpinum]|uniref:N-acetyltransferase domain-containing protein n=1 Tax=Vulcanimicrobium alpinum TaxID=3016050 RepID=A0AAN1XZD5_UNVUL|nr:GNAT family N-acetyltransferase [Vulcanimicrobium alpinum]BDE08192.1 hypothetical protein WPS_34680 [Vulcanimicrobium alpinum]